MKIDRLISIIMILLERQKVSLTELSEIFEVTPRTIQRDLDAINQAGIPIVSSPGVGGGVGIMENYKLEKRLFSTADVTTLLMGLGSIRSSLTGSEVVGALAKVKGMIPEQQRRDIELKAGQISIDTTPWAGARDDSGTIALIQTALEEKRLLRFIYTDRRLNKTERTVEPYRLVLKGMCWYMEGYSLEREDFRLFKLSRMAGVEVLGESFTPREFTRSQQVEPDFQDKGVVVAQLRVKEAALERITDAQGADHVQPETENSWIAHVPVPNNEVGYKYLLGFGADCECLGPENLREGLVAYLRQIIEVHAKDG